MPFNLTQYIEQFDLKALRKEMNQYISRVDCLAQHEGQLASSGKPEDHEMLEDLYYAATKLHSEELCQLWQNVVQGIRGEVRRLGLRVPPQMPERLVIGYLKEATPEQAKNPPPLAYFTAWCMLLVGIK